MSGNEKRSKRERNTFTETKHVHREARTMIEKKRGKYVMIYAEIEYNSQIHRTRSILLALFILLLVLQSSFMFL